MSTPHRFPRLWTAGLLVALVSLLWSATVHASSPDAEEALRAGHAALEAGEFERGLAILEELRGEDSRVAYYRAYALEKLGRCAAARTAYQSVDGQMAPYALRSLEGLAERCTPVVSREMPRGSGRFGWKFAGWTSMVLGTLTVLAVPVKASVEQGAAAQAEQYFQLRYGCEVDGEDVGGPTCKEDELRDDEGWAEYRDRTAAAARTNRLLLLGGGAAFGLGLATVLTVALTRPSPVAVTASPVPGGASVGVRLKF